MRPTSFENTDAGETSLAAVHAGSGTAPRGDQRRPVPPIMAISTDATPADRTLVTDPSHRNGIYAAVGDTSSASTVTDEAGVYGFADVSTSSVGVVGESFQGVGLIGFGDTGVVAFGHRPGPARASAPGARTARATSASWATSTRPASACTASPAARQIPNPPTGIGVYARAGSNSQLALRVQGRAKFSRSGRVSVSGATKTVTLAGVERGEHVHRRDLPGGRRRGLRALGRPGQRLVQDPPVQEAEQGGHGRLDRLREAVGAAMSYPRNLKREKWTGRRIAGAADDMAWERQVEAVHAAAGPVRDPSAVGHGRPPTSGTATSATSRPASRRRSTGPEPTAPRGERC